MLGYVIAEGRGVADTLLEDLAMGFMAEGWRLAGAVQINTETDPDRPCDMHLHVLNYNHTIRISQDLGALAKGCRLDPEGLERVVGLVEAALERGPELLIVNKFGKQEMDGRGFRPAIGRALSSGIPVLCTVNPGGLERFLAFVDGYGEALPANRQALERWCRKHTGHA